MQKTTFSEIAVGERFKLNHMWFKRIEPDFVSVRYTDKLEREQPVNAVELETNMAVLVADGRIVYKENNSNLKQQKDNE